MTIPKFIIFMRACPVSDVLAKAFPCKTPQ